MPTKHCGPLKPQKHIKEEGPARWAGSLSWVSSSQTSQGLLSTHGPDVPVAKLLAPPTAERELCQGPHRNSAWLVFLPSLDFPAHLLP